MGLAGRHVSNSVLRVLPGSGQRTSVSDEQIIAAVLAGDEHVANQLYERLVDTVDRTLYRVFGRREQDHEDLIQKSFEQIILTLVRGSFAGACSLRTWASSVTSRVAFNALRARKRERRVFDRTPQLDDARDVTTSFEPTGASGTEGHALARADLDRIRAILVHMNPGRAEAVFLHDVLGHELAEIAVMEGISVAAAQSRLVRGRAELYESLGVQGGSRSRGRP